MRQIEVEDGRVGNVQCKWVGGGGETESERRNRVKSEEYDRHGSSREVRRDDDGALVAAQPKWRQEKGEADHV